MKEALQHNRNIVNKASGTEKKSTGLRQYIYLAGKVFDVAEIGGKIHVFL